MFKVNFMANQEVTAEDINKIGYNLANTQYTTFADKTTYGIDDLNAITQNLVTAGVRRNDEGKNCNVTLQNTTVHIGSGMAFFGNGAVMTIDEDGINIELADSAQTNYVYLFYDKTMNVSGARCTVTQPSDGDYVLLATVQNGSIVQNVERFCKSKVKDDTASPLLIYNEKAIDFKEFYAGSTGGSPEPQVEEVYVPNLVRYTLIKIYYLEAEDLNRIGNSTWWAPANLDFVCYVDFQDEGTKGIPKPFFGAIDMYYYEYRNKYYPTRYTFSYGNPINIVPVKNDNSTTFPQSAGDQVKLKFDFENDILSIIGTGGRCIPQNGLKLELYAGEVEDPIMEVTN